MGFTRACALADLAADAPVATTVDDVAVAVVLHEGDVYAIHDECSHASIPLSEGDVTVDGAKGPAIECWLHSSSFSLRTGEPLNFPATESVPTYPTTIEGDRVYVVLPEEN